MSPSPRQNIPASVRQRLLNLAHGRGEDFQFLLTRFALERLLYRLGASDYAGRFLLKGALLFSVWSARLYRPTRDLDLAGKGECLPESVAEIFRALCQVPCQEDGLIFDPASVRAEQVREPQRYPGARVRLVAYLATARIPLQIDIGYGDAVSPGPEMIAYPTLLGHPAPQLRAYPQETFIAEKFHALVVLGIANTRIKDFYDLWVLAGSFDFKGPLLSKALRVSFQRRQTPLPRDTPLALTPEFSADPGKRAAWRAFLHKAPRQEVLQIELREVCGCLEGFLLPPSRAAASGDEFPARWLAPGPWVSL